MRFFRFKSTTTLMLFLFHGLLVQTLYQLLYFFFSFFLDVQIVFEGIKGTPVKDDNEVRNDDDEKEQEQNEHDAAELT